MIRKICRSDLMCIRKLTRSLLSLTHLKHAFMMRKTQQAALFVSTHYDSSLFR